MSRLKELPSPFPPEWKLKSKKTITSPLKDLRELLKYSLAPSMNIELKDGVLTVSRPDDSKENRSMHGLTRTLLSNMVEGVTTGYKKELTVQGVGYKVAKTEASSQ